MMRLLTVIFLLVGASTVFAHPLPDVPVRSTFGKGGACRIEVEIDPRCFEADPNSAPSVLNEDFAKLSEAQRDELKRKAVDYITRVVGFFFEPQGRLAPEWKLEFTTHSAKPLTGPEDVVVLTAAWETKVTPGTKGYRIHAFPEGNLSVLFLNTLHGQEVKRIQVLFPGEKSFLLSLDGLWSSFGRSMRQGFAHVLPYGVDHIMFVGGLFLLNRGWAALLWQVSAFTFAHTLTLALATIGGLHLDQALVEPIIALSVVAVGVENLFHSRVTIWRLVTVFGFGLIHGLGFADGLRQVNATGAQLLVSLFGFNLGVEMGQVAILASALLATAGIRGAAAFRTWIAIPASIGIVVLGAFWTVLRIVGPV